MADIRYIEMTIEEKEAWLRDMAKLCIGMHLDELLDAES